MNPNKQKVDLAIIQLTAQIGKLPEVWRLEEVTGFSAVMIIRNLDENYPKELNLSQIELRVLDAYKENHSIKAITTKLELGYYDVSNTLQRLKNKGFIKRDERSEKKEKYIPCGDGPTYIAVIKDVYVKVGKTGQINVNGARGFINGVNGNKELALVYLNSIPYHVSLYQEQYKVVGGDK